MKDLENISKDLFQLKGKEIAIATMHGKEKAISPLLSRAFGWRAFIPSINTDLLGTFTGEIERENNMYETAKKKCELAFKVSGCDIAISSEGSFGPHPHLPFKYADEELVLLVDRKNKKEYYGVSLSENTNFSGRTVYTNEEVQEFISKVKFPEHAVIIKDKEINFNTVYKGINTYEKLIQISEELLSHNRSLFIETDMRAMFNPLRMKVIGQATENLIKKLKSKCPECGHPGFWIKEIVRGLPCINCKLPTRSVLAHKYACLECPCETIVELHPPSKMEDPMYCNYCNP